MQSLGWKRILGAIIGFFCGDATGMPVREDSYDAAFASLALSVIPDVREVIETVYDVLKPGGAVCSV